MYIAIYIYMQVWKFMRADANDVAVRLEAMPQNTTSNIKDDLRKCAGGRTGRRDFLTLLPSAEEAASVKKVACATKYAWLPLHVYY